MIRIKETVMFVRSIKQLNIDMIQIEHKNKNKVPNNRNQRKNKDKKNCWWKKQKTYQRLCWVWRQTWINEERENERLRKRVFVLIF